MKLFAGGSKSITNIESLPNRRVLDNAIYYDEEILVGDCRGADVAIQKYLAKRGYYNVTVYASGKTIRNNIGGWEVRFIEYNPSLTGYDFYRQKDIQMELDCDHAVMAWDGHSKGTRQNIIDLMALGKRVDNMLWQTETDEWYYLNGDVGAELLFGPDCYGGSIKIWLDDSRPAPGGFLWSHSVDEAKLLIETAEGNSIKIDLIDCDHDLGMYAQLGGDGIKLLDWLAERETYYPITLHTMNPVGRENMQRLINRYWKSQKNRTDKKDTGES